MARHIKRYVDSDGAKGHEWRPGVFTLLLTNPRAQVWHLAADRPHLWPRRRPLPGGGLGRRLGQASRLVPQPDRAPPGRGPGRPRPLHRHRLTAGPEEKPRLWELMTSIWPPTRATSARPAATSRW